MESTSVKLKTKSEKEKLFVKIHKPDSAKKAIICLHGGTEYHIVFDKFKNYLGENPNETCLICPDLRGHGLSSGLRNYVKNFNEYLEDLEVVIESVKNDFEEIYIWGHSLSAIITMKFVLETKQKISGIILSNPPIRLENKWSNLLGPYAGLLTEGAPQARIPTMTKGKDLYSDKDFATLYDNDPLIGEYLSVNLCLELNRVANIGAMFRKKSKTKVCHNLKSGIVFAHTQK